MEPALPLPLETTGPFDEAAALAHAQKGDAAAFGRLYRAHYPTVIGCLHRRTGDPHAAEDLAAETFLSAFKAIPRYRVTEVPLRIWLLRIATNAANKWCAERQRLRLARVPVRPLESDPAADHEAVLEEAQAALLALSAEHQAVLSLHYLESLSLDEVASVLGCKVGTVKSRLARARDAMRDELERRSTRHD